MKRTRFPIMKKTRLLQTAHELIGLLFSLFTAYSLSGTTEKIQTSVMEEAQEVIAL